MSRSTELALPCRLITLQVRTSPTDQVRTVEDIVSRAVLQGHTQIDAISDLLVLPKRIVVDVIAVLWGKGHLTVDFETGELDLSDAVRTQLAGRGKAEDRSELKHRKFLFEPVTGLLLAEKRGVPRPHPGSVQLPLRHGIRMRDIPQVELIRAVQAEIRRDQQRGIRENVLEVAFGSPVLRHATQLRWLHVPVSVGRDPRTHQIVLTSHTPLLSGTTLSRLENHLTELAETEPTTEFAQKLHGVTHVALQAPERLDDTLDRLQRKIDELATLPPSQAGEAQRVLVGYANRVRDGLALAESSRAAVQLVTGESGHKWSLFHLLEEAREQVVIATPRFEYSALRDVLPTMRKLLDRNVQIVLVWGSSFHDKLPERYVETALDELSAQFP